MDVQTENAKRLELLKKVGMDGEGFGFLNTFFLYDQVVSYFGWLPMKLYKLGFDNLAVLISEVNVSQLKTKGSEIYQTVIINGSSGQYKQKAYIHDDCPDTAVEYICEKYNLTN
jgi:hypothetical protein